MLSQSMSNEEIINILQKGEVYVPKVKVTIPEGFELKQIAARLEEKGLVQADKFLEVASTTIFDYPFLVDSPAGVNHLEGYLFPATYQIAESASEKEIMFMMLNAFNRVFKEEYYGRAEELGMNVNELMTLASIVEREAKLDEERSTIASVFHNRLKRNKPLESCATIQFALGERKQRLLYKDLEIKSPYNTYKNPGLPPGPISSVGEKSIIAALYPEDTDYLYFRTTAKNDGSHHFSKTFDEHQRAGQ